MNYIIYIPAVQTTANNFNGVTNKAQIRRALAKMDGSRMIAGMEAGAYDYKTACKKAMRALRKELKERGKI
jgi:hypothetical protein